MDIAIPLYDRFTALDAIGPYEVLSRLPGARVTFVGAEARPYTHRQRDAHDPAPTPRSTTFPTRRSSWCRAGRAPATRWRTSALLDWIRAAHETTEWTTSVCTGSLLLGAAGLLDGPRGHHALARAGHARASYGAHADRRRVVEQGKVITAAGVSSGIDMALFLLAKIAGDDVAQDDPALIEYDPQPPFDAGSPEKAAPETVAQLRELAAART